VVVVAVAVPALTWAEAAGKAGDRAAYQDSDTVMDGTAQGLCGIEGADADKKNAHGLDQTFLMRTDSHHDG